MMPALTMLCNGLFALYHAHLQFCRGEAEMAIRNSSNIAVFELPKEQRFA